MRVFLSCVSIEFKSYRLKLANQLGALKDNPCEVKVQEDFQQGGYTLLDKLADYIGECDFVIHFAGDACGVRPTPEHVRALFHTLGDAPPDPLPERSYTQWEYQLAGRFKRKLLVYLATVDAPRDYVSVRQTEEEARLQQSHLEMIRQSGKHYAEFSSYNTLVRGVFHDLGLEPHLKINNLPYKTLGSLFKGREQFLAKIHDTLGRAELHGFQRSAIVTAPATAVAVHGLGGSGKTRAAVEYAHRYSDEYTTLLFVRADSPASLQQNLAALCGPDVFNLREKDERKIEVQVAAALQWLQQHASWLLIFDNADTEESALAVQKLLGELTLSGQVLVTSRLSNWAGAVKSLSLDVLEEADSVAFLLERTEARRRRGADEPDQARAVAVVLGHLPLALEQAGAYIDKYRFTLAQYLAEWQGRRDKVLAWFDARLMEYPMSVAVTWQTSFDSLSEPARELLRILAWFAPDPIPESLLDEAEPTPDAREALADLEAYSLVTRADETPSFTVHRLVQDVTRRSLPANSEPVSLKAALAWVGEVFVGDPRDVRTWPVLAPLAPHALTVALAADTEQISEPTARLMNDLGQLYDAKAQYDEAEPLMRRALAIDENSHGPVHPDVARDLNNLALLLQATNRPEQAEPLMRRAVDICSQTYGPDDPQLATSLDGLATLLLNSNRLAEAEPLMRRALAIFERHYGPDHPDVATVLNNLAALLQLMNRIDEAEPLIRRALAIDEHAYGADHPYVARDLNNLAQLLQTSNRPGEAEPRLRRALAIDEKYYGPDHPKVAIRLTSLASLLQEANRLVEAEPLLLRALSIDERSYGSDHPEVAKVLNNLGSLLKATNRFKEAEPLLRRVAGIFEKAYGPEHPLVATGLDNLALLLMETDRPGEAEPLVRRTLAINEFALGPDHPEVAITLSNLAGLLQETNRLSEAEPHLRRALAIDENSYGPNHPRVAADLNNLALLLKRTKRVGEAEPLYRRSLAIHERSYGPDHPRVAADLNNLARLLQDTDRLAEAEPLMRRGVEILWQFTIDNGHQHPHLRAAMNNYGSLLQQMGSARDEVLARLNKIANRYGFSYG